MYPLILHVPVTRLHPATSSQWRELALPFWPPGRELGRLFGHYLVSQFGIFKFAGPFILRLQFKFEQNRLINDLVIATFQTNRFINDLIIANQSFGPPF